MKLNRKNPLLNTARFSFPLATAIAALFAGQSAQAQTTRYWDQNGATSGFGSATGTWQAGTVSRWSNGTGASAGTATPGLSITTLINDPLHFGTDTVALGSGTITVSGTVNAASLRFGSATTGNVTLSGGVINLAATTSIHVGAGGTTVHTITSEITGAGTSLTKTGNTLQLSGANSYTGSTIISSGILILNNANALGGSNLGVNGTSAISMAAGTTLQSNFAPADLGAANSFVHAPITLTGATANFLIGAGNSSAPAESVTFNINGAIGGLSSTGVVFGNNTSNRNNADSIIVLGAASTYTGNTTIQAGNVQNRINVRAGVANALPTTTVLSFDAVAGSGSGRTSQFDLNGNNQTLAGLSNGGLVPDDRNHRVNSATAATLTINNSADFSFGGATKDSASGTGQDGTVTSAQITGAISLVKDGAGTFTLGGTLTNGATAQGNAFTGSTKILGGILVLGQSDSIRNSAFDTANSIAGDATNGLRTTPSFLRIGGLTGGNDFATRFTSTSGGYNTLTGLTLNPNSGDTLTYSGDVGDGVGGMNLTKSGAGTQILSGTNTHTGSTTVSAGVLAVNGSLANTSTVTVSGTGILKGSGSINSSVTINSGGTLASGTSIESLAVGGDLSFNTASNFQYELDSDHAEQGDLTAVTGNLNLSGTVNLLFVEAGSGSWELGSPLGDHFGTTPADKLTLISYTGVWNNGLFTLAGHGTLQDDSFFMIGSQQWFINYNDTDAGTNYIGDLVGTRFLTITVPEPGAALLGGLGLLALLRRRR